jgi:hypothetical protein
MTTAPSSPLRALARTAAPATFAASIVLLLSAAGCNYAGPAAYALFGPGKIEAQHQLQKVRTVVFVDDRQNLLPRVAMRAAIGEKVSQDLIAQQAIPSAVRPADAIALTRQREDGKKPLSIAAIGRELEVQQVVYVQITGFSLEGDGSTAGTTTIGATPTATAEIKVIDVVNSVRTFPSEDGPGQQVLAKLREVDRDQFSTVAKRRAVEDRLTAELGEMIGKLFYQHERIDLGENLGPR